MSWEEAHSYIEYLNTNKWRGYDSWRLPTVEELMTLPSPSRPRGRLHESIKWLWSGDAGGAKSAWVMDIQEAYFLEMDKSDMASVCGVTTIAA